MALLPGLRGMVEDRPGVQRRSPGRVGVKGPEAVPDAPKLHPAAAPVDTYARPAKAPIDDNLMRLSQSLASLSPSLMRFAQGAKLEEQKPNAAVNAKLATMTPDEAMKDPEVVQALAHDKNQELFAARLASATLAEAREEWGTANKDEVNIDQFIAGKMQKVLGQYGGQGRDALTNEFIRLVTPGLEGLRTAQVKHNVERVESGKQQGAASLLQLTIENGVAQKRTPDEIATAVRAEIQGNKTLAGLDPRQQEAEVLAVATRHAQEGNVDLVRALVNAKDGRGLNLLQDREHGAKAAQLVEAADSKRREKARESGFEANQTFFNQSRDGSLDKEKLLEEHKANPGRMSDDYVRGLITHNDAVVEKRLNDVQKIQAEQGRRQAADNRSVALRSDRRAAIQTGQYWRLGAAQGLKENGDPEEIDAEKQQKLAVEEWVNDSRALAARKGETPQQRFERELPVVLENGFDHPEWKKTLEGGYKTAAQATINREAPPARLSESLAIYKDLHAKAPQLIPALVGKEAGDYYEYLRVATEDMELPIDKAHAAVMTVTKDPVKLSSMVDAGTKSEIRKQAGSITGAQNVGYLSDEIQNRSIVYAGLGHSSTKALELAKADVERTHININGFYIPAHDRRLPPDFKDLVMDRLKDYAAKHGKAEGFDASDITVRPAGNGTGAWEIIEKATGIRVDDPKERLFTIRDLKDMQAAREAADKAALIDRSEKKKKPRAAPPTERERRKMGVTR